MFDEMKSFEKIKRQEVKMRLFRDCVAHIGICASSTKDNLQHCRLEIL